MSSNLKVNSLVPATGTAIGIGTTGGTIDFRCPATFGGNVTIGGTLTYDEVINIDSIGIVTARSGLKVTGGQLDVGNNIKLGNAGVVTATTFSGNFAGGTFTGDGSGLTGIAGTEHVRTATLTVSGVTTVTGNIYVQTLSTFSGGVDINADLDVDGQTSLDHVNIAGVTTYANITSPGSSDSRIYAQTEGGATTGTLTLEGKQDLRFKTGGFNRWVLDGGDLVTHGSTYNNLGRTSTSGGRVGNVNVQYSVDLINNAEIRIGDSDDLKLYHNGSNSYISNSGVGNLMITGNNSDKIHIRANASKQEIVCVPNAGVQIFHNDNKKLETVAGGVNVYDPSNAVTLNIGAATPTFSSPTPSLNIEKASTGSGPVISLYNSQSANAASTCDILVRQNYRDSNKIIFGRENANNWQSSAGSVASFTAFYTNSGSGIAERLRITSAGKVIIRSQGAAASDGYAALEIRQNTGGKHLVLATNSATSSTNEVMLGFKLHPSGQDERVKAAIICRGTGTSDYGQPQFMSFCLDNDGDNGNATVANDEKFRLNSDGTHRFPNMPSFCANLNSGHMQGNGSSATTIVWNNEFYDNGSHYNSSNGRFTAPIAGIYRFSMFGMCWGGDGDTQFRFRKNGNAMHNSNGRGQGNGGGFEPYGFTVTMSLAANDYVTIEFYSSNTGVKFYSGTNWNGFSGHLIG